MTIITASPHSDHFAFTAGAENLDFRTEIVFTSADHCENLQEGIMCMSAPVGALYITARKYVVSM